jgi:hypothetical protein
MRRLVLALCLVTLVATAAQAQPSEPVGPFVIDVRGLMAGLPTDAGWIPALPQGTIVPSRGFGLEGGAHVYPVQWGPVRLGLGAALTMARGTAKATATGTPDVVTKTTTFAPQLSFNFGHRQGFSYLSAGYGAAKVASDATAVGTTPALTSDSGWSGAMNIGGGARWFISEHFGVGFEARWHRLSAQDAVGGRLAAPRATLFHLAVGISVH